MGQSLWSKGVECGEFCLTLERILDIIRYKKYACDF